MVTIKIRKSRHGYEKVEATNHADDPIVCAAVSSIVQGLCATLLNVEPKPCIDKMIIQSGYVNVEVFPMQEDVDQRIIDTVFEFAHVSLAQIEKKYPQNVHIFTEYC